MVRWWFALVLLALILWATALAGLLGGSGRGRGDAAAVATIAVHLGIAAWLRADRRRPTPGPRPAWADVQAERHRRLGGWFAAWGIAAALGWFAARPGTVPGGSIGWPAVLALAGNCGFQPGMLAASGVAVAARARLGRALAEPAGAGAGA